MKKKSAIKVPFQSLTAQEREIVITTSDADDALYVYVASPKEYLRLASQGWEPVRGDRHGAWFELPKAAFTIRSRASIEKHRPRSPAQRESHTNSPARMAWPDVRGLQVRIHAGKG